MNQHESSPTPEAPERRIPLFGFGYNYKVFVAFILGVFSILLMFVLGECVNIPSTVSGAEYIGWAIFITGVGGYFLISQYFLSRGNPQGLRKVWPLIIAMNFLPLCAAILCLIFETKGAALGMLLVTMLTVACSYAGAALAARTARQ